MSEFEKTYLYKPTIGSSHTWALKQFRELPAQAKILDFGAGSGIIGLKLQELGQNQIYAVDLDPDRRIALNKIYLKCTETLAELDETDFNCIILLDILEHLTNPFEFLGELTKKLAPGGVMLISIPNIAHWSMRLGLLFGFFEYTERGLLDKTHYSFFNKRRAISLARSDNQMQLVSYNVSVSPAEFVLPELLTDNSAYKFLDEQRLMFANFFPSLLGYQHLMKLKKKA